MALTLATTPSQFSPAFSYKGVVFVVTSNAGTVDRLKVEVEVNLSGWVDVITFEQPLDLNSSTQFTVADIGKSIATKFKDVSGFNNFLGYLPAIDAGAQDGELGSYTEYRVTFTERLLSGGVYSDGATKTFGYFSGADQSKYVINSTRQYKEDQSLDDYIITVDSTALDDELIANGTFDSSDNWIDIGFTPMTISGGVATATLNSGQISGLYQPVDFEAGEKYLLELDVTKSGAGQAQLVVYSSIDQITQIDQFINQGGQTNQSYSIVITATGDANEFNISVLASVSSIVFTFDNISIKKITGYLSPNGTPFKFFTNAPTTKWIREGESEYLGAVSDSSILNNPAAYLVIKTYTKSGSLLQTAIKSYTSIQLPIQNFPVGYSNINAITSLTSGTQPLIDENVYKYEVYLSADAGGFLVYTGTRTFKIDRKCYENTVRFHFLNRLGGIDSFTATGRYIRGLEVDSEQYQKLLAYNYEVGDRGLQESNIDAKNLFSVNTGIITKAIAIWLMELKTSPQVFIEVDDQYCPVIITNKNKIDVDYNKNIQNFDIEYIEASPILVQKN